MFIDIYDPNPFLLWVLRPNPRGEFRPFKVSFIFFNGLSLKQSVFLGDDLFELPSFELVESS